MAGALSGARTRDRPPRPLALAAVVTLAMVFGALTPLVVGALGPYIVPALSLSKKELGLFVTSSFAVATLASPASGRLVDRVDGRVVVSALFGIGAVTLLGLAATPSLAVLLALALPAGVVQAACNPVTNRLIALYVTTRLRGIVVGTKQAGVHIGGFAAGLVLPVIALAAGWRAAVTVAAAAALAALWLARRVVPPGDAAARGDVHAGAMPAPAAVEPPGAPDRPAPSRGRDRLVAYLTVYAFFMGGGVAAISTYMPLYAHERIGLDETTAGSVLAAFSFTGVAARLAWGWAGDRVVGVHRVLGLLAAASTVAGLLLWHAEVGPAWTVWVAAVGLGLSAAAWNAVGMLAVVREVPEARVGHATGVVNVGFFGGFILSPIVFGAVVDATGDYRAGWLAIAAHFLLATALSVWSAARAPAGGDVARPAA